MSRETTLPSRLATSIERHGTAKLMREAGETVSTVAGYLGHATPAVTMTVYAHAVPESKKRAADRQGAIFRSAAKDEELVSKDAAVSS